MFAGAGGTVAMTGSSALQAKLHSRGASSAPAQADAKMLGVQPVDEGSEARFSNIVPEPIPTSGGMRTLPDRLLRPGPERPRPFLSSTSVGPRSVPYASPGPKPPILGRREG